MVKSPVTRAVRLTQGRSSDWARNASEYVRACFSRSTATIQCCLSRADALRTPRANRSVTTRARLYARSRRRFMTRALPCDQALPALTFARTSASLADSLGMQSLPVHERRAPIQARWARLGPRVESALALNCDALTRSCLIDSIVRGGVRDGVNLSNEGLLEVFRKTERGRERREASEDVSRASRRLTRRPSTCCSCDNRSAHWRPLTPHSARRARTRAQAWQKRPAKFTRCVPRGRAGIRDSRRAHAKRWRDPLPKPARDPCGVRRSHGRNTACVREFAAGVGELQRHAVVLLVTKKTPVIV